MKVKISVKAAEALKLLSAIQGAYWSLPKPEDWLKALRARSANMLPKPYDFPNEIHVMREELIALDKVLAEGHRSETIQAMAKSRREGLTTFFCSVEAEACPEGGEEDWGGWQFRFEPNSEQVRVGVVSFTGDLFSGKYDPEGWLEMDFTASRSSIFGIFGYLKENEVEAKINFKMDGACGVYLQTPSYCWELLNVLIFSKKYPDLLVVSENFRAKWISQKSYALYYITFPSGRCKRVGPYDAWDCDDPTSSENFSRVEELDPNPESKPRRKITAHRHRLGE